MVLVGVAVSVAAVQAEVANRLGDRGRNEVVNRLSPRNAVANLAGRDRGRGELERNDAVAVALEIGGRIARAGADGEAHPAQNLVGLLPARKGRALVGADDEERIAEAAAADRVDGEGVVVQLDLGREIGERGTRQAQARLRVGDDFAVARTACYQHEQAIDRQPLERRPRERDVPVVRRVEGTAEDGSHWSSSAWPATSTSSPFLAPASRRARSSSSSAGGRPMTRKPRSVLKIR